VNAYIKEFLGTVQVKSETYNFIYNLLQENRHIQVTKNCIATDIPNCKTFKDQNTCAACGGDYLLFNNKCINPSSQSQLICLEKDDQDRCVECSQGYFLSEGSCETVASIFNCQLYDTKAAYSKCTLCTEQFYLNRNKNECL
jgi:hypothetical protein